MLYWWTQCNMIGSCVYILKYTTFPIEQCSHYSRQPTIAVSLLFAVVLSQTHIFVGHDDHGDVLFVLVLTDNLVSQLLEAVPAGDGVDGKKSQEGISLS